MSLECHARAPCFPAFEQKVPVRKASSGAPAAYYQHEMVVMGSRIERFDMRDRATRSLSEARSNAAVATRWSRRLDQRACKGAGSSR